MSDGSASTTGESLRARAGQLGELEQQWMDSTRSYVRENPLTALGIAVLAGVVLSKIASRD